MSEAHAPGRTISPALKRALWAVIALNLGYFFVEFGVAKAIGSVSLFADSIDFLEDSSVNLLVLLGLGLAASFRRLLGMGLAGVLLVPAAAALLTAWQKFQAPVAPDAVLLTLTGTGALLVNAICAVILARVQHSGGSLTRAAYLSARNDVAANLAAGRALRRQLEVDTFLICPGPDGTRVRGVIVAIHPVTVELLTDELATVHVPLQQLLSNTFEVHPHRSWVPEPT